MEQVYNQMYHKPIAHWNNADKGGYIWALWNN